MPVSGALVIAIAMPPTKANPPTIAIVDRLNLRGSRKSPAREGAGLSLWVSRMGLAGSPGGKECGSKPSDSTRQTHHRLHRVPKQKPRHRVAGANFRAFPAPTGCAEPTRSAP